MTESDKSTKYKQLNERARWYSSQLWYIPFAYVGLIGIGIEKTLALISPFRSIAFIFLGIFSLSVYVHVTALKYYERRAVGSMRQMENNPISSGGSPWYMNFVWYTQLMLLVATYTLIGYAILDIGLVSYLKWIVFGVIMTVLTIVFVMNIREDRKRNKELLKVIR